MTERLTITPAYDHLRDFIGSIPAKFDSLGEIIYSGRNTIRRITAPDGTIIVVKRFGRLSAFRRLIYTTVAQSKAQRAYENALRFKDLGFSSPEPVAYIEINDGGLLSDAYFISLNCDYAPLFGPLVEAEHFDTALADDVAALMAALHEAGAMHGDPNLNNILYDRLPDGSVAMSLIDTNRSRFGRRFSTDACLHNLMRVSHRRDLMREVVGRYASLRGLDPQRSVDRVFRLLERFERNRRIRHSIKDLFRRR